VSHHRVMNTRCLCTTCTMSQRRVHTECLVAEIMDMVLGRMADCPAGVLCCAAAQHSSR